MNWLPSIRKSLCIPAVVVMCITILGAAPSAGAEQLGTDACLPCHGEPSLASDGVSLFTDPAAFEASTHGMFACTTCHTDITEIPHADRLQAVRVDTVCATCHADAVTAYQGGSHGQANSAGATEAPACADCHGDIHEVKSHTDPQSAAHWSKLATTCAHCHANADLTAQLDVPLVRPVEAYLASVHARLVAAGVHGAVCSDCHGSHDILPGSDARSSIARTNVPATCGKCHKDILDSYNDSVHGAALARGHRGVPSCTDCHGEHRILGASEPTSPVFAANLPGETCGRCHGDARLNDKYGLAIGNVAAFRDSFHGLALRSGEMTVANCASCHGVHDIRPSSDPLSHVHAANLPATCGKCHPGAGTVFTLGSVHGAADSTGTLGVAWVRWIYLWLIGATIAFMLLHNLIDLGRKIRRPYLPVHTTTQETAERFPRLLRFQHGLVMISFPVLVYSGFALTYPESWWAAPLLRLERTIAFRGVIHRCAAVALMVALVWHVVHFTTSRRGRDCLRAFFPAWRDVIAVAHHFRLCSRPASGARINYAEKLEYWAFMWGCAIMTATGLLLWFETPTLRYLPGWVPDVATAIHFYEAILAALSILVWHLYFVIFDPDVYPVDWSWWDGRPPPSRAHEREEGSDSDPGDGGSAATPPAS